jgi:hypothetical protein
MYLRTQILTFKFRWRLKHQPPFTLLSCIHYTQSKSNVARSIWKRFELNKLWKAHLVSPTRSVSLICLDFIKQQVDKWATQKSSSRRALRSAGYGYDPIFFFPCTRLERLRLIKWRLHWLPSFPAHACNCGASSVKREHYLTCPFTSGIVSQIGWNLPFDIPLEDEIDDAGVYQTHLLDRLLNALPSQLEKVANTHWEFTWPLILQWITRIDVSNHPDGYFENEPYPGDLFLNYYRRLVPQEQ